MENWFWILDWILSILTVTGNGFIIFLVSSNRQLRTKTNAFIVSLAVADFSVGAIVAPSLFFCDFTGGCNWPVAWPTWDHLIRWLFSYSSMLNLGSLVLERYIAVVKPLKYITFVTSCRVFQMIFFSWAIPSSFVITTMFLSLYSTYDILIIFTIVFAVFFEIVLCCMLIFWFISMVLVAYKHNRSTATLAKQLRFNHRIVILNTRDKSAVLMMSIVVGLFLVCYGIYLRCSFLYIFNLKRISCNDSKYKIPILLLNSAVNPWAYAFFKRDIKKEFKKLICRITVQKDNKVKPFNAAYRFSVGNSTL